MKKLVAFAAIVAVVSFASCGNKQAENAEVAETEAVVEQAVATVEDAVSAGIDTIAAEADTIAAEVQAVEAAPAE